jgi:energy-coupling factor transport system substrate-specific component
VTWVAASFLLLGVVLVAGFAWYERTHPSARVLALVATLAALAAIGRIAFAPIPNVKPTTDIVLLAGVALGGAPGFAVGAVAAIASNLFFGQGTWTPWQMAAWGLIGIAGAGLALVYRRFGRRPGRVVLSLACALAGLAYGAVMNFSLWVTYSGDHTWAKLATTFATSLPFDLAHAGGNVVFCLAFGPALLAALLRFRARFDVEWRPAGAALPAAGAVLLLGVLCAAVLGAAAPGSAHAERAERTRTSVATSDPRAFSASAPAASLRYLAAAQNADGGFGPEPRAGSSQLYTAWVAIGFGAAGRDVRSVERNGRDPIDYIRANLGSLGGDVGERARTMLALRAAGISPARFAGRDLLAELTRTQRSDGSFAGRVNSTAFAILAMRAANRPASDRRIARAARWLARQANGDGGFNFQGKGGRSGADDTSAAVQGLAAAGKRSSRAVTRAAAWFTRTQNADGGFGLQGGASNAQSTAWAVQGLVAAGRDPGRLHRRGSRSPAAYLRSLLMGNGAVRYSRTSAQAPVWVTAQAVTALAGRTLPILRGR